MDDKWQCGTCGARNDPGTAVCYRCGTPRLIPPIPGTRVYDPVRAPSEPGKAPVEPGPPAASSPTSPTRVRRPMRLASKAQIRRSAARRTPRG